MLYCNLHGHIRKHNVFMYGNNMSSDGDFDLLTWLLTWLVCFVCVCVCVCVCVQVMLYCDLHGHSRKHNVFMYGNNMSSDGDFDLLT
jgi:hypothetical protein